MHKIFFLSRSAPAIVLGCACLLRRLTALACVPNYHAVLLENCPLSLLFQKEFEKTCVRVLWSTEGNDWTQDKVQPCCFVCYELAVPAKPRSKVPQRANQQKPRKKTELTRFGAAEELSGPKTQRDYPKKRAATRKCQDNEAQSSHNTTNKNHTTKTRALGAAEEMIADAAQRNHATQHAWTRPGREEDAETPNKQHAAKNRARNENFALLAPMRRNLLLNPRPGATMLHRMLWH
jgi:type IV secretory pathway VirB10-like protein